MQFRQLSLTSLVFLGSAKACLHDHIPLPRSLEDEFAALRNRDVPAAVKTAIQNVRVFDGSAVSAPQTIIIDGGYIMDSNDTTGIEQTIDAGGSGVLIPGLIDAHAHVESVEGLHNMTSYGVTTIFDMACPDYALCESLKSNPGLANLYVSMLPALGPSGKSSPLNPVPADLLLHPGKDPKYLVDYAFGNGSDYFKIVNAPVGGPTQDQQDDIVGYTHSKGKLVVTHAPGAAIYAQAVASRSDVLQHIPDDGVLSACTIESMRDHGQAATPTMEIFRRAYTFQPQIIQFLRGNNTSAGSSYANVVENVRRLHEAGVPLLAGTDAVGSAVPIVYFPFGESLHQELVNFVHLGMTPAEALRAATIVPATVHRLNDRGGIRPGMRADLILLNSNPLDDISNTRDIARVWAGGVEYPNVAKRT